MTVSRIDIVTKMVERLGSVLKSYGYEYSGRSNRKTPSKEWIAKFFFVNNSKGITLEILYYEPEDGKYDQFAIALSTDDTTYFTFDRFYALYGPKENDRYFIRIPTEMTLEEYVDHFYHFAVKAFETDFKDYITGKKEIIDLPFDWEGIK